MEIVKAASEWAKAEIVSAMFFMLFGLVYLFASIGLWQYGTTSLMKATFIPLLVAGALLLMAGIGFYFSNKSKLNNFEKEYKANPSELINSELSRAASTIKTYENVALKVFPLLIIIAGLVFWFVSNPTIKGICIGVIAFFFVLVLLDSQALKRMKTYHQALELESEKLKG